jgi:pimeloyl-[acyl-carrier protein] methyl ester esterase
MQSFDVSFIPGAAGLGSFWDPVRQELPGNWRSASFDLPGLGPVPPHTDVQSYAQLADYVARAIERRSVLVGQSMGGYVALELTLRYPQLVSHLVLTVAAGGVDMARHATRDWRPQARIENPGRAAWTLAPVADLAAELHRIEVPVLLIWATRDPISPLGVAEQLAAQLPRARLVTFDSDDHWVARARAAETARFIRDFLLEDGALAPR